jgi:hypothetical protein
MDPMPRARALWLKPHPLRTIPDKTGSNGATSVAAVRSDQRIAEPDQPVSS